MRIKQLLLTATAAAILTTTGAMARDYNRDHRPNQSWTQRHDNNGYRDRNVRGHDRYWREGYRGFAHRDLYHRSLRAHHYYRWDGDPYWLHGRFVIRSYDRFGRPVFVELNPYTGSVVGVIRL